MKSSLGIRRISILAVTLVGLLIAYVFTRNSANELFITAPVERGTVATYVRATGTIEAVITVDVSSQLSGRIAEVLVNHNEVVKQGQVIARLDPEIYIARVSEARAALKVAEATALLQKASIDRARMAIQNAQTARKMEEAQLRVMQVKQEELERDYERFFKLSQSASVAQREMTIRRSLRDENAASMRVMEQQINLKIEAIEIARAEVAMAEANLANAEAVVEQKQAALDQAEVDRERTQIRAPISGVILKRDVNPGQTVAVTLEAKTLFKIAHDLREMEVRGRIDEADVGKLSVGQTATFSVDAYPGRLFKGHVLQIRKSPEITQNVVTYTAIISAPNPDLLLLPGMTATLRIAVSETESTLKIPNQALRFRPEGEKAAVERAGSGSPTVWVIGQDRRPSPVPVTVGRSDNNSTELLSGELSEGQPVIIGTATSDAGAGIFGLRLGF
jgi:HlyD family secretion protein